MLYQFAKDELLLRRDVGFFKIEILIAAVAGWSHFKPQTDQFQQQKHEEN